MDKSTFISVNGANNRLEDFTKFMDATTHELKDAALTGKIDYNKYQGEKLEGVVLDKMKSLAYNFQFNPEKIFHTEKQHFPDIISENYFGVEVKATKSKSWTSIGSSITESLRDDCVKKVFLLFGRLSVPEVDFRCKPYEECLCDISVTHNPRYLINMDLSKEDKTIFQKLDIEYDNFRINDNRIDIIRNYYRNKYIDNGKEMPWWIGEDNNNSIIEDKGVIRLYTTISKEEKNYLKLCGFILFPEVLASQHSKLALWLCSRHSIVNPSIRDMYSAGGQMDIYVNGVKTYSSVPKSICNLFMLIDSIRNIFNERCDVYNDISYYSSFYTSAKDSFSEWKDATSHYLQAFGIALDEIIQLTFKGISSNKEILMESLSVAQKAKYSNLSL